MINDLQDLFAEALHDLGGDDPLLHGIFTPWSERGAVKRGVTAQFLENAAEYHERYANVEYFRGLIDNALATVKPTIEPKVILDIGSGSGNSVIPLLDRFNEALVVAIDISPQLLAILRDHLSARPAYRDRFALVCMDASKDPYRKGRFDLAVGAAILHHIIEPERVIRACERALRPGAAAIFFEPFEMGHALLSLAYREILAEADRRQDESPGIAMLRRFDVDYAKRGRSKTDPVFDQLDDKWMFSRSFFESFANRGCWAECRVYPIHGHASPLTHQTEVHLGLMGADPSVLSPWAWTTLSRYESAFSERARRDFTFEGAVVMRTSDNERIEEVNGSGWWWNPAESGRGFFVERQNGLACVTCFGYDDEGNPTWHAADPAPFASEREITGCLRPLHFPLKPPQLQQRIDDASSLPSKEAEGVSFSMQVEGPRKAQLDWVGAASVALEPQHSDNPGLAGIGQNSLVGWWIEDHARPSWAVVVECTGNRVVAALLSQSDWCLAVAVPVAERCYMGEWSRFHGGQTITGPYRPPSSSQIVGKAVLEWTDTHCLVVKLTNGRHCAFTRLGFG